MHAAISVIIPSLNSPLIATVVDALRAQTAAAALREIIVVGRDERGLMPGGAQFIDSGAPIPAAAARNRGARVAQGDLLLFIDSDCVAAPDLVERLLDAYAQGHRVIGGGLRPGSGYWRRCDDLLVFSESLPGAPAGPRESLPSCNLLIERALFLAQGGFDERFPGAAGEDFDLSVRLREAGVALHCEPLAIVEHRHRRAGPREIWAHLRAFGRAHARIVRLRPSMRGSRAARLRPSQTPLIMAAALPLALLDIARLYRASPALRGHLSAAPGMVWARVGWYWGLAEGIGAR